MVSASMPLALRCRIDDDVVGALVCQALLSTTCAERDVRLQFRAVFIP